MIVKEVLTEKDRNAFFEFPLKLYKGNKYVVVAYSGPIDLKSKVGLFAAKM